MDEKISKNNFHEKQFHISIVQTIYFVTNIKLGVNGRCLKLTLGGTKSEVVLLSSHGMDDVQSILIRCGGVFRCQSNLFGLHQVELGS